MKIPSIQNIRDWTQRAKTLPTHQLDGYAITPGIDGGLLTHNQAFLVSYQSGIHGALHCHQHSRALFVITRGQGRFITILDDEPLKADLGVNQMLLVPAGMIHGVMTDPRGNGVEYIAIHTPPSHCVDHEDYHAYANHEVENLILLKFGF